MSFEDAIGVIKLSYERFIGTGFYFGLFLLLLGYIIIKNRKENKYIKVFFSLYSISIAIVILNPIFYYIVTKFIDTDVYWRSFWCIPLGITIAYGFSKMIKDVKNDTIKKIMCILIIVIIGLSGKFIYTSEFFSKVNNYYKVPDDALEIIMAISEDDEEYKKVAGPEEIMVYMRQIDGTVETEEYRSIGSVYFEDSIISEITNGKVTYFANKCIAAECNYVVIANDIKLDANIEKYAYEKVKANKKYTLYKIDLGGIGE